MIPGSASINRTISSSCPTADTNATSTCASKGSRNTTCSSSSSTCDSNTNASACSASNSCSSHEGEGLERNEASDRALLDTTTGNLEQNRKLLDMSNNLIDASSAINGAEGLDNVFINAMLHLADDISVMSERISKSADKVMETDNQNEKDLNRAVTVSEIIFQNNTKIQQNLIEVQQNFNDMLTALNQ